MQHYKLFYKLLLLFKCLGSSGLFDRTPFRRQSNLVCWTWEASTCVAQCGEDCHSTLVAYVFWRSRFSVDVFHPICYLVFVQHYKCAAFRQHLVVCLESSGLFNRTPFRRQTDWVGRSLGDHCFQHLAKSIIGCSYNLALHRLFSFGGKCVQCVTFLLNHACMWSR